MTDRSPERIAEVLRQAEELDNTEFRILAGALLYAHEPPKCTPAALARMAACSPGEVSRVLDRLTAQGYLAPTASGHAQAPSTELPHSKNSDPPRETFTPGRKDAPDPGRELTERRAFTVATDAVLDELDALDGPAVFGLEPDPDTLHAVARARLLARRYSPAAADAHAGAIVAYVWPYVGDDPAVRRRRVLDTIPREAFDPAPLRTAVHALYSRHRNRKELLAAVRRVFVQANDRAVEAVAASSTARTPGPLNPGELEAEVRKAVQQMDEKWGARSRRRTGPAATAAQKNRNPPRSPSSPATSDRTAVGRRPTATEVEAARTPKGGYTRPQLAAWGVPWPPPKGWKEHLLAEDTEG